MFCKNCGKEIPQGAKYCIHCGTEAGKFHQETNWTWGGTPNRHPDPDVPDYDVFDPTKPASAKFGKVCPVCGKSNIRYETISESNPIGCFAWTVILIGAFCVNVLVFIAILLVYLIARKSTRAATYATCQYCGHRWKT